VSYGIGAGPFNYQAVNLQPNPDGGLTFDVSRQDLPLVDQVALQVPGEHNVRNALAALCVVDWLGLGMVETVKALHQFRGAGRRFDVRGDFHGVTLVDDYAHHPTEIRATLAAARMRYPNRRLWAIWQPHTYSRTRALFEAFSAAFDTADCVLVTEIYAARETTPEDGFSARQLADAIASRDQNTGKTILFSADLKEAVDQLMQQLRPGDVVVVLSAGDADRITVELSRRLPDAGW